MRIKNEPFDLNQTKNTRTTEDTNASRAQIKRNNFNENDPDEKDPFDLELRIEPRLIQDIIAKATESKFCGSKDNDCTGCGCNTCCSSC